MTSMTFFNNIKLVSLDTSLSSNVANVIGHHWLYRHAYNKNIFIYVFLVCNMFKTNVLIITTLYIWYMVSFVSFCLARHGIPWKPHFFNGTICISLHFWFFCSICQRYSTCYEIQFFACIGDLKYNSLRQFYYLFTC